MFSALKLACKTPKIYCKSSFDQILCYKYGIYRMTGNNEWCKVKYTSYINPILRRTHDNQVKNSSKKFIFKKTALDANIFSCFKFLDILYRYKNNYLPAF